MYSIAFFIAVFNTTTTGELIRTDGIGIGGILIGMGGNLQHRLKSIVGNGGNAGGAKVKPAGRLGIGKTGDAIQGILFSYGRG